MAKKTGKLVFEGKDKEHYDALMHARDMILGQMQYHAEDALDCSNADKRMSLRIIPVMRWSFSCSPKRAMCSV